MSSRKYNKDKAKVPIIGSDTQKVQQTKPIVQIDKAKAIARHHLSAAHFDCIYTLRPGALPSPPSPPAKLSLYPTTPASFLLHSPHLEAPHIAAHESCHPSTQICAISAPTTHSAIFGNTTGATSCHLSPATQIRRKKLKAAYIRIQVCLKNQETSLFFKDWQKALNLQFEIERENFYLIYPDSRVSNKSNPKELPAIQAFSLMEVENVGDNDDEDQVSNFSSYSRNTHKSGGEVKKGFGNLGDNDDDKVSNFSSYSRYTHKSGGEVKQGKIRAENSHWEGEETEREEVQCSEWESNPSVPQARLMLKAMMRRKRGIMMI
ncbi:hypothetical protein Leryth_014871 [Lithospermum erythrorhizon]|nr:hypothetical protein Leryth_014871 [Lithospermum erythrorhizon]